MSSITLGLLLGLVVGLLSGALGIGGGGIMVPALVLLLGVDQATAQGTSLLAIIPTAATGAYEHFRLGAVDTRLCLLLGAGGTVGALLGALVALHVEHRRLREIFAVYLLVVGAQTLWRASRRPPQNA